MQRKGATRVADIPRDILADLNAGRIETRTLAEGLAIDFGALLSAFDKRLRGAFTDSDMKLGITARMARSAQLCIDRLGASVVETLASHRSDTLRGIGCYAIAQTCTDIDAMLQRIRPLAADAHFGVREWAWLACRPSIANQLDRALQLLCEWTEDSDPNVRRFASESTRPRGVWCAHVPELKQSPARAVALLEPLHADPSRYVQDSVGNWLNDAAKDNPDWVRSLCQSWQAKTDSPATRYIVRRGLRSLSLDA